MTVDLVTAYNNDPANEKLQGVQLDIEPYLERSWSRNVTASLQAYLTTIRDTVSFHMAHGAFDASGQPIEPDGCTSAAQVLLDQLAWWASALRTARHQRPSDRFIEHRPRGLSRYWSHPHGDRSEPERGIECYPSSPSGPASPPCSPSWLNP